MRKIVYAMGVWMLGAKLMNADAAGAQAEPAAPVTIVQHIGFNCRDLKKSEAFYTRHFGFKRARVFNRGRKDEFIMLRLGSTCLELFPMVTPNPEAKGQEQRPGFKHLAFLVPDIKQAVDRLHADGFKTGDVIDCSGIVPGMKVCFFGDPDGNTLELMQGYQDEEAVAATTTVSTPDKP